MDRPKSHRHRRSASVSRKPARGVINRINPNDGKKETWIIITWMCIPTRLNASAIIFPEGHEVTGVVTERQSDVKTSGVTEGWERFEGAPRERI